MTYYVSSGTLNSTNSTQPYNIIGRPKHVIIIQHSVLQVVHGLRTLAAALRVLQWPHLLYDCIYTRRQLYKRLLHLERSPDTDYGLYNAYCAVRCSSSNSRRYKRPAACLRSINETLRRTGFDLPFRNTSELVATTCAYLRVMSRFVKCCRNLFASAGK